MGVDSLNLSPDVRGAIEGFPCELRKKSMVFLRQIERAFRFLVDIGYSPAVLAPIDDQFPYRIEVLYGFSEQDREVSVRYIPRKKDSPREDILVISMWRNLAARGGIRGWDAKIWPDIYLSKFHPDFDVSKLDLRSFQGPFQCRLELCLEVWASVLQNELQDVILGTKWVNGMYVTPFD
ncbi:MAG: hypothetical protein DRJ61_11575 [Acidobacteria bacterium]|nr:MAG: hypothetical protein DRJ61_11575 [Acidobacteriota bacterium]